MRPPYTITDKILHLVADISEKMGEINAGHLYKSPTELRKKNRIKTIHSSLEIEGNTLTEEQITFSRKRYLQNFKHISAPPASRDLKWAVDEGILNKMGAQRLTVYHFA